MAESNNLLREKAQILEQIKRIQAEEGKEAAKLDATYIKLKSRLVDIVKDLKGFRNTQNDIIQGTVDLESGVKSLSTVYSSIKKSTREQAIIQKDIANGISKELESGKALTTTKGDQQKKISGILSLYNEQANIATELSQLNEDDVVAKSNLESKYDSIADKINSEVDLLDKRTNIAKTFLGKQSELEGSLENQINSARDLSSLSERQKGILEEQGAAYESIRNKVEAIGSTLSTYLQRPQAAVGALVIGAGFLADKFAEVNRELGNGFELLNSTTASAGVLSFIFEDTAGTVKALSNEFGDVSAASFETQVNVGLISTNMGVSNTEAVSLLGSFARLNEGSTDIAADMVKTTQQFAKQNGIIPSALMQDLAASTEEFALFGKAGGENILEAAGYAQKLGVNMSAISGITDNLLDFESSITKELELGAMLGKSINLDKARQLAMEGKLKEATEETLNSLGGISAFNEMDYFQKKATADLLGVSVAEFQKMAENQEKASELAGGLNEKFSMLGETLEAGANKYLGTTLKGLGSGITMAGELGMGFKALGVNVAGITKSMGSFVAKSAKALANVVRMGAAKIFKTGGSVTSSATKTITKNAGKVGKGAGSGGLLKGLGGGMKGIASGLASFANPATLLGLAAVTAAIIGIGFALKIAAPGIKAFGEAVGSVVRAVGDAVKTVIQGLGDFFTKVASVATPELVLSVMGLAGGFAALATSLAAFSVAGLAAIPAMIAVSTFSAIGGGALLGLNDEADTTETKPVWVEELKTVFRETKDVYIDGDKITAKISSKVDKIGSNSYVLK